MNQMNIDEIFRCLGVAGGEIIYSYSLIEGKLSEEDAKEYKRGVARIIIALHEGLGGILERRGYYPGDNYDGELRASLREIESLAKTELDTALEKATKLVLNHPDKVDVWAARASIYIIMKKWKEAISDLTNSLNILQNEPALLYERGRCYMLTENYQGAIDDFTHGLAMCENDSNYFQGFYFMKAYANNKLGEKQKAYDDLENVRNGYMMIIDKLCTKKQLIGELADVET